MDSQDTVKGEEAMNFSKPHFSDVAEDFEATVENGGREIA
jgi:hypothetical protein